MFAASLVSASELVPHSCPNALILIAEYLLDHVLLSIPPLPFFLQWCCYSVAHLVLFKTEGGSEYSLNFILKISLFHNHLLNDVVSSVISVRWRVVFVVGVVEGTPVTSG